MLRRKRKILFWRIPNSPLTPSTPNPPVPPKPPLPTPELPSKKGKKGCTNRGRDMMMAFREMSLKGKHDSKTSNTQCLVDSAAPRKSHSVTLPIMKKTCRMHYAIPPVPFLNSACSFRLRLGGIAFPCEKLVFEQCRFCFLTQVYWHTKVSLLLVLRPLFS